MQLTVYKASAGSGKTFRLAVEYIKLLIKNPENGHRNILAVTFTNKATEEMKERIMSQLYGIWKSLPTSKTYLEKVSGELGMDEAETSRRAGVALSHLIHDFDHFRVQTIDKFFQSILRNLAHELGLASNLRVGLNDYQVEELAVDQLIEGLSDNDRELGWIIEYIKRNISEDKGWNVTSQIKSFGKTIFSDTYKAKRGEINDVAACEENFKRFYAGMMKIINKFEEEMAGYEPRFSTMLDENGVDIDELKKTPCGYFRKLKERKFSEDELGKVTYVRAMESADEWVTKAMAKKRPELTGFAEQHLMPLLREAHGRVEDGIKRYYTARMSMTYLNQLRLLSAIEKKVGELNADANRFLLSDTQQLLSEFVKGSDSPFIYEKIGTQISHVMIDEFQDTSTVQWQNFLVLLKDCMSRANPSVTDVAQNLIVGDVKQSIYRWRSGDWQLLNNIENLFASNELRLEPMRHNFRSAKNIIRFNNAFFETAIGIETVNERETSGDNAKELEKAYGDLVQKIPEGNPDGGMVKITLLPSDSIKERTLDKIVETIDGLTERGVPQKKIAVLLRRNSDITLIAEKLMQERPEIHLVSDEAFRLEASLAVNMIIEAMRLLAHPEDLLTRATLAKQYQRNVKRSDASEGDMMWHADEEKINALLPEDFTACFDKMTEMPLTDLIEYIYDVLELGVMSGQSAYICAFHDAVCEFAKDYSPGIDALLREWDDDMCSKNIQADDIDGIRIMTIHKSKGLEYDNVILPFANWKIGGSDILWCATDEEPFCQMPLIPVRYSKEMDNSLFSGDYRHEHLQTTVDNMNLLYVAFTRAASNLFVIGQSDGKANRSSIIRESLSEVTKKLDGATLSGINDNGVEGGGEKKPEAVEFLYGSFREYVGEKKQDKGNVFLQESRKVNVEVRTFPVPVNFRQSNESDEFTHMEGGDTFDNSFIKRGCILHKVFSQIETTDDVPRIIREMEQEGIIYDEKTRNDIIVSVGKCLGNPTAADWFSGRWKTFRECPVLKMEDGKMTAHRPDRVMTDGERTIVVDYKFGTPRADHVKQIGEYMRLLDDMGYMKIKGCLWYVDRNIIKEYDN